MDQEKRNQYYFHPEVSKIIQWVIKYSGGLIKNEKQVFYIFSGLVIIVFIVSLFLIFSGGNRKNAETFAPPVEAPAREVIPPSF